MNGILTDGKSWVLLHIEKDDVYHFELDLGDGLENLEKVVAYINFFVSGADVCFFGFRSLFCSYSYE